MLSGNVGIPVPPSTLVDGASNKVEVATNRIKKLTETIHFFGDQLSGPVPEVPVKSPDLHGVPVSLYDKLVELNSAVDCLEAAIRRIDSRI